MRAGWVSAHASAAAGTASWWDLARNEDTHPIVDVVPQDARLVACTMQAAPAASRTTFVPGLPAGRCGGPMSARRQASPSIGRHLLDGVIMGTRGRVVLATAIGLLALTGVLGGQAVPAQAQAGDTGRYVVVLADPPLGEQPELTATQSRQAVDRVAAEQDSVLAGVEAEPTHRFDTTLNGFSVELSPAEVRDLEADPEVAAVTPVRVFELHQDVPSDPEISLDTSVSPEFLGLSGVGGVWEQVGGPDQAGRGQVIGVIDSGVDWSNASFDATGVPAPPAGWQGTCDPGEDVANWPAQACTNKLVGARYFIEGLRGGGGEAAAPPEESVSPWDVNSHGSHVASIAAGRQRATVDGPIIAGMAPLAHLAVYKVCWDVGASTNCAEDDVAAAVEAAVEDGVDVLNLSLGSPDDLGYENSAYDTALKGAAAAGVFVSMSAGNYGPSVASVSNGLPWATTVAAATFRSGIPSSVPAVATTSSRGPVNVPDPQQNLLKPDLGAPGVNVVAAVPGGEDLKSGTSMSAPHIAGLAAIIRGEHPTWSPMAVKSAMQTSARDYAGSATHPLIGGAGFVEPRRFLEPGLVFDAGLADWAGFIADLGSGYDLNTASVTIGALGPVPTTTTRRLTNVTGTNVTYTAAYSGPSSLDVTVTPQQIALAPGGTAEVTIRTFNRAASPTTWQAGWVTWSSSTATDVRIPITARGAVAPMVDRWGGADRYATAAVIAGQLPAGTDTVYLASGNGFPDALAGSPVAARGLVPAGLTTTGGPAPILLVNGMASTPTGMLPAATRAALADINPDNVVILGGPAAVPVAVQTELENLGHAVARVAGPDRYATAAAAAMLHPAGVPVVYIASGADFPDALTGAAAAARDGGPVLLTRPDSVPSAVTAALEHLQPERIVVLGGTGAVSAGVFNAIGADERLSGPNRYATSAAVAATFGADLDHTYVARGDDWPDALAGSALAGAQGVPVVITTKGALNPESLAALDRLSPQHIAILGGVGAVSVEVEDSLNAPSAYPSWATD